MLKWNKNQPDVLPILDLGGVITIHVVKQNMNSGAKKGEMLFINSSNYSNTYLGGESGSARLLVPGSSFKEADEDDDCDSTDY